MCHEWAPTAESVRCDTCRKFFHMRCLSPPLASKPAKGYSWNCAPCAKQHDEMVEEEGVGGGGLDAPGSNMDSLGPRSTQPTRRKRNRSHILGDVYEPVSETVLSNPIDRDGLRCFQGWPYRYFGEHTSAMDVLDAHDSIYPRAVTRQGPKFQAVVPSWESQQHQNQGHQTSAMDLSNSRTNNPEKAATMRGKSRSKSKHVRSTETHAMDVDQVGTFYETTNDACMRRGSDQSIQVISIPPPDHDWQKGMLKSASNAKWITTWRMCRHLDLMS